MADEKNIQLNNMIPASISAQELLSYLVQNGKIDLSSAEDELYVMKRDKIIEQHPYKIYQGSNGKWYTHVPDMTRKEKRRKIVRNTLDEIKNYLYEEYSGIKEERILKSQTIETLYPKWIEYKSYHTSAPSYITRLQSDWRTYYEDTPIVKIPIVDLKKLTIDEWMHKLIREKNLTRKQYTNIVTIINQILDYAVDLEIVEVNQARRVKIDGKHLFRPEKKKDSSTEVFTKEEANALKKLAWADFDNRIKTYTLAPLAVLFQFETGVRIGELLVLRFEDVNGDFITVQRMYRRDCKEVVPYTKGTYGDRRVVLTTEAKRIIETSRKYQIENGRTVEGYIFSMDDNPCSYFAVTDLYEKYCKKIGTVKKTSHKARKTVISAMIDGKVNINTIREMAGHRDEKTTYANYVYDRSTDAEKVKMVEKALAG